MVSFLIPKTKIYYLKIKIIFIIPNNTSISKNHLRQLQNAKRQKELNAGTFRRNNLTNNSTGGFLNLDLQIVMAALSNPRITQLLNNARKLQFQFKLYNCYNNLLTAQPRENVNPLYIHQHANDAGVICEDKGANKWVQADVALRKETIVNRPG